MLNTVYGKRNANFNYVEIPFFTYKIVKIQNLTTFSICKAMER